MFCAALQNEFKETKKILENQGKSSEFTIMILPKKLHILAIGMAIDNENSAITEMNQCL